MRFRLRYLQHDLELTETEFTIGRSASCQLSVDDPLVSRRHASFTVAENELWLADLGSRNGVLVNGAKIERQVRVRPGDRVTIGSQELTVMAPSTASAAPSVATTAMDAVTLDRLVPPAVGALEESAHDLTVSRMIGYGDELSSVRRLDGFRLLGSVAEKALAMGRADEAERMLATQLTDVLEMSRAQRPIPLALAEEATRFAAKLATVTGKGSWVEYVVEVYTAMKRPAPAAVIDELYGALRKVTALDLGKIKAYVELLREDVPTYGPADRFLFQRIEGLERLGTLRA